MPEILGADGKPLPRAVRQRAQRISAMSHYRSSSAYQAARHDHASTANWHASGLSGASAARQGRAVLTARVRDMVRNDSAMAAGIESKVNNVIGSGLRLDADPDYDVLGIDAETGEKITDAIEHLWDEFANDQGCWIDAERNGNLTDLLIVQANHMETEAETFAINVWRDEPSPVGFQTCMQIVHPARCSNPNGTMDNQFLREGVVLDEMGAAIGYHFRRAHPGDTQIGGEKYTWDEFPRDLADGRPYVMHAFDRNEAGLYRSVSRLWAVLRKQIQGEQYFDTELQAAQLNAIMALFIETPLDMHEAADSLLPGQVGSLADENKEFHKHNPVEFHGVQTNILAPGEKPTLTKPEHPNPAFEPFMKTVLRSLASIIGITYEQLTGDWSEVNYSSARAAILEVAKGFRVALGRLKQRILKPFYWAWLQEVFDKNMIELPAGALTFEDAPEAWARGDWIGAGKGYVDPLKEVQAAGLRVALGLSTMKQECAEQGGDYRTQVKQTVREIALMQAEAVKLGLDPDKIWHPAYAGVSTASALAKSIESNAPETPEPDVSAAQAKRNAARGGSGVPRIKRKAA